MLTPARRDAVGWRDLLPRRATGLEGLQDHPRLVATTSGRAAIWLALRLLGLQPGDRVLVPTFHCPSMLAPLRALALQPIFYPLDATGRPDLAGEAAAMGAKAILAAHWFGRALPMRGLRSWCDARRIALIEDCAHTLYGRSDGRPVGGWGDCAIGSLTKFLPVAEGGVLVIGRPDLAPPRLNRPNGMHALRTAWRMFEAGAMSGQFPGLGWVLRPATSPHPHVEPLQREVDLARDAEAVLDEARAATTPTSPCRWVARHHDAAASAVARRRCWQVFANAFSRKQSLRPLWSELGADEVPYVFPLWVNEPDAAYAALRARGMPVWRWDRAWPGTPDHSGDTGRLWGRHVFQIACHRQLDEAQIHAIVGAVLETCGA